MATKIQIRRGTAANWTSTNPVLAQGELGFELDTLLWKAGDGVKTWTLLPYSTGPAGVQGPPGQGVPSGGGPGQALIKNSSTSYDTVWATAPGTLPADTVIPAATRIISNKYVGTDAQAAWVVNGDGSMSWGAGGGTAPDAFLKRLVGGATPGFQTTNCGLSTGLATSTIGSSVGAGTYQGPGGTFGSVRGVVGNAFSAAFLGDTGTYRWAMDSNGKMSWADGTIATPDVNLYRVSAGSLKTDGQFIVGNTCWNLGAGFWGFLYNPPTAANYAFGSNVQGEAQPRYSMYFDGRMNWGPGGSTVTDTNLYRSGAGLLQTDSSFVATGGSINIGFTYNPATAVGTGFRTIVTGDTVPRFRLVYDGSMAWGTGAAATDTNLYRAGVNYLATGGSFYSGGAFNANAATAATNAVFQAAVSGDTQNRFYIRADGYHAWGPGNATTDTTLYRYAAGMLATDGRFEVGSYLQFIGTGGSITHWVQAAGNNVLNARVSGDAFDRFYFLNTGVLNWGPGNVATDTNLYRAAGSQLQTDGQLRAGAGFAAGAVTGLSVIASGDTAIRWGIQNTGTMNWGPGNAPTDTTLYRNAANQLRTGGSLIVDGLVTPASLGTGTRDGTRYLRDDGTWQTVAATGALPADTIIPAATRIITNKLVGTDTQVAFQLLGSGELDWGPGGTTATDTNFYRRAAGQLATNGILIANQAVYSGFGTAGGNGFVFNPTAAGGNILYALVQGEAQSRFNVDYTGRMNWGPGASTVTDTNLYRAGAATLKTDGNIQTGQYGRFNTAVSGGEVVAGYYNSASGAGLSFGSGGTWDTNLYRNGANSLRTDGGFYVGTNAVALGGVYSQYQSGSPASGFIYNPTAVSGTVIVSQISGEANNRFNIRYDGQMNWGPGGATATDTNLYRSAAGTLGTTGNLGLFVASGDTYPQILLMKNLAGANLPGINFGTGGSSNYDTNIFRWGASYMKTGGHWLTGGQLWVGHTTSTDAQINFSAAGDLALYRTGAGSLALTGSNVMILQIGNMAISPPAGCAGIAIGSISPSGAPPATGGCGWLYVIGGDGLYFRGPTTTTRLAPI